MTTIRLNSKLEKVEEVAENLEEATNCYAKGTGHAQMSISNVAGKTGAIAQTELGVAAVKNEIHEDEEEVKHEPGQNAAGGASSSIEQLYG